MKKTNDTRFSYDFVAKTIIGTKASFDKASKGFGPVYEELADEMAKQPTFKCVVKAPKQPAKVKQTYKGNLCNRWYRMFFFNKCCDTLGKLRKVVIYNPLKIVFPSGFPSGCFFLQSIDPFA